MAKTIPRDIPVCGLAFHTPRPACTAQACPACGSRTLVLKEIWKSAIEFQCTDGWVDLANGNLCPDGEPIKVCGICVCGHEWTLRKVSQVSDIAVEAKGTSNLMAPGPDALGKRIRARYRRGWRLYCVNSVDMI